MPVKKYRCILGEIIDERGYSQLETERRTGVPQTVISRYIRGSESYRYDYLAALRDGLELDSIESLFTKIAEN